MGEAGSFRGGGGARGKLDIDCFRRGELFGAEGSRGRGDEVGELEEGRKVAGGDAGRRVLANGDLAEGGY